MLSIVIPSRKEKYLQRTIDDVLEKATGAIEIIAVLDGYWPDPPLKNDYRVKILHYTKARGLRNAVNMAVAMSSGEYIMKVDAHCMFDKGFDEKLTKEMQDNWVMIPRRYKLDTDQWKICEDESKPIDYDKIVFTPERIYGQEWLSRKRENKDILIDDTMLFQGSCWVMSRKHFDWLGGLSEVGYGTFTQEPIEIGLKTWLGGGRVVVNKKTWYAHQHRKFGRTHQVNQAEVDAGYAYAVDYWMNNRWEKRVHDIQWLRDKFKQ